MITTTVFENFRTYNICPKNACKNFKEIKSKTSARFESATYIMLQSTLQPTELCGTLSKREQIKSINKSNFHCLFLKEVRHMMGVSNLHLMYLHDFAYLLINFYHLNMFISFKKLDQKAFDDFSDIYPQLQRPNHIRCWNIRTTFSMATQQCNNSSLILLVVPDLSEQVVQSN